jgi:hypothetical protein
MRRFHLTKKAAIIAAGVTVVALGLGGIAYAFFPASGSGNGYAQVGSDASWGVTINSETGTLYPDGVSTATFNFSVQNTGGGSQVLNNLSPTITQGVTDPTLTPYSDIVNWSTDTSVTGCITAWFNAAITSAGITLPQTVAAGASATGYDTVTITMPTNSNNQFLCEGTAPVNIQVPCEVCKELV